MTGAGFGGCTVNLVRNNVVEGFMERVGTGYECKTGIKPTFYHAEISNGTREILINN
jgi:galactokinase